MTRYTLTIGAVFGLLSVSLGAFGAHGLQNQVSAQLLATWATASDYLGMHALVLLVVASLSAQRPGSRLLTLAAWCFVIGSLLFSGSLFVRVLTDVRAWVAVTPVGGTVLIAGWTLLAFAGWRTFSPERAA